MLGNGLADLMPFGLDFYTFCVAPFLLDTTTSTPRFDTIITPKLHHAVTAESTVDLVENISSDLAICL